MKAIIEIRMDNAAFEEPATELTRILGRLSDKIKRGMLPPIPLVDYNGNTVGTFTIEED